MGWLREILSQAAAVLKGMTPVQRATIAALVLTVALVLAMAGWLGGRPSRVPVVRGQGLPAEQLGRIQTELEREGIDATVENGDVLVAGSQVKRAYFLLKRRRLVKDKELSALAEAIAKMKISDTHRRHEAMLHEAEERDLERIIETIEGVGEATVKIMERRRSAFGLQPPEPVGVTISVAPAYGRELDQMLANTIISMAHNAVWRSQPDRIVVTDASTGGEFRKRTQLTFLQQGGERFRLSEAVERRIAAKIEKLLRVAGYPPNVAVWVKLDLKKTVSLIEKTYDPKEKGAVEVYRLEETTESEGRSVEGVVGAARGMGLPVAEEGAAGAVKPETSKTRKKEFSAVADVLFKHVVDAPGEIAEVRVSGVLTPRIVEKRNEKGEVVREYEDVETAAKQKELEDWRRLIANVTGAASEAVELAWRSSAYLSPEGPAARPEAELLAHLERYGPMAVVSLLAMLALFFLYGLGRRATAPAPVPLESAGGREREDIPSEPGVPEEVRLREMQNRIRLMAGRDPRKVSSLVKRWIVREG